MSTLALGEARAQIETDLNDTALQAVIDDAEAEIVERIGAINLQVDIFREEGSLLFLSRKMLTPTMVVEEVCGVSTTLATNDYKVREANRVLERLRTGTNPRRFWGDVVTVTYVPEDDTVRRKQVVIDLVKLAIAYTGQKSERIGDYTSTSQDYKDERSDLIDRLRSWSF